MIPILFLSDVKGNMCNISYVMTVWSGSCSCKVEIVLEIKVTPTLLLHSTKAIFIIKIAFST